MLSIRTITAVVLAGIAAFCFSFSPSPIFAMILCTLFIFVAGSEYAALRLRSVDSSTPTDLQKPEIKITHFLMGYLYCSIVPISYFVDNFMQENHTDLSFPMIFTWIVISIIGISAALYTLNEELSTSTQKLVNLAFGFLYIAIPGVLLYKLSQMQIISATGAPAPKAIALYFSLAIVFAADTGAYFTGIAFGKHPLLPKVSPKKTIEGAVGGLISAATVAVLLCVFFKLPFYSSVAALIGIVVATAGIIGDLLESAIKRAAHCKDSGNLLPGHGGVLDRIDALLLGVPFCYLLFILTQAN